MRLADGVELDVEALLREGLAPRDSDAVAVPDGEGVGVTEGLAP